MKYKIKGNLRYIDLDAKIGRFRKSGGGYINLELSIFTHKEISKMMKFDPIYLCGTYTGNNKKCMIVESYSLEENA